MADSKITALTSISTSTDPANDPLVIVDVSDTSMAATGTTKKVTLNQLLGASGTATLASATISGDLTVDTNVLKVDTTNNVVGIGTATPQQNLHVVGTGTTTIAVERSGATIAGRFEFVSGNSTNLVRCVTAKDLVFEQATGTEVYRISSTGVATWSNVGGVAGTAMTLNATGLGLGETAVNGIKLLSAVTTAGLPATSGTTQSAGSLRLTAASTTGCLDMGTAGTVAWLQSCRRTNLADNFDLALNPNGGNVGIGVTPAGTGGCLQLKSGITFPATQVASSDANTLDDYEEGTWTIGLAFGGGSTGLTTSSNTGRYTKIGRVVTVSGLLVLTNKGSSTGAASVTGLPFSIGNNNESYPAASLRLNGISYTGAFQAFGTIGSTFISFEQISTAGSVSSLTDSNFTNVSSFIFSLTYTV